MRKRSPPAVFAGFLVVMAGLAIGLPGPTLVEGAWRTLGLLPLAAGVSLHRASTRRLRVAGTPVAAWRRPTRLVSDGVFGWSRNPMYLAGVLILAGVAVCLGVTSPLLLVPAFVVTTRVWFIRPEEEALEEQFGEPYRQYRQRVRRWA